MIRLESVSAEDLEDWRDNPVTRVLCDRLRERLRSTEQALVAAAAGTEPIETLRAYGARVREIREVIDLVHTEGTKGETSDG